MRFLCGISLFLAFYACKSDNTSERKRAIPNISNIPPVPLIVHRFDQDLLKIDTNHAMAGIQNLQKKEPIFNNLFFERIVGVKHSQDSTGEYYDRAREFLTHPSVRRIADTTQIVFKDFNQIQNTLQENFRFYKFYFPNKPIPEIYTFAAQYNFGVVVLPNNALGIGLDMFLGANHPDYADPVLQYPAYVRRTFDKTHLPVRVMEAMVQDMMPNLPDTENKLLDFMIQNGKQMYVVEKLLPQLPDSVLWGYTAAQTDWCKKNEAGIWAHLIKEQPKSNQNLLYSNKYKDIIKLYSPAPNSPGMPPEAPGRTANYIGLQIIRQYMEHFPNTSLEQLLQLKNAAKILEASKYKP
jgi:hypothetical protein